jgi:hypothetical protein
MSSAHESIQLNGRAAFAVRLAFEEMPVRVFGRATICPFCLQVDQIVIFWVVEFAGSSD